MISEVAFKYPAIFLVGLLVSLVVTPRWIKWGALLGFVDKPGGRKIHATPVSVGGGIAIFLAFHASCLVIYFFPWKPFAGQISMDWWLRFLVLSTGVVILGLLDDRFNIKPMVKLGGQVAIVTLAYMLGIRLQNVLGVSLPEWFDYLATLLWFLALMNSFNLIDGIDGLATGIGLIAAVGIGISLVFRKAPGDVLLFLGFAGACLGFLRYNFYPASVFLGDTGSLFIGFTLAALAISTSSKAPALAAIGMPLLAVGVPLFDTLLAVWRRSIRHFLRADTDSGPLLGIDRGDADHLHHRLLVKGRKHDQVAWLLYGATAVLAASGILASVFHDRVMGILGLTFLVGAYTVIRHLAWIELRDSGQVVLKGISRPVRRNRTLIFYIITDILILNAAMLGSRLLLDMQDGHMDTHLKSFWLKSTPVDVVIPFLVLLLFRSYSRVWYLARISEYISSGLAVMLGCGLALTVNLLVSPPGGTWTKVLYYLLMYGLATPAIVGIRASVRVIQDVFNWRTRSAGSEDRSVKRVLVCGAGYRTTLFLRQLAFRTGAEKKQHVVGLVASDDAIRGHYVHGIRVLGNFSELPALIAEKHIDVLYLVEDINPDEETALINALAGMPIKILRWQVVESEVGK